MSHIVSRKHDTPENTANKNILVAVTGGKESLMFQGAVWIAELFTK